MSNGAAAWPPLAPPKPPRPPGGPPAPGTPPPLTWPNSGRVVANITIAITRRFIVASLADESGAFTPRDFRLNALRDDVPHPEIAVVANHEGVRVCRTRLDSREPVWRSVENRVVLQLHLDVQPLCQIEVVRNRLRVLFQRVGRQDAGGEHGAAEPP